MASNDPRARGAGFADRVLHLSLVPSLVLLAVACSDVPPPTEPPPPPPPPPAPVASVTVYPGTPSILVGTTVQLAAITTDAQGKTLSSRAIAWSSSAEATATVSAAGLVTGVSVGGPVTITATSEGQLGTAQVVVTAPPLPGYTISPTPALSVSQGSWSPNFTVYLLRTNFTGNVTLSVENLPTGVRAHFSPASPISGSSADMSLFVAGHALAGTYANLLVRGVASGLTDRTAQLTLTITVAPFILTWSAPTLSIAKGGAPMTTTVNVVRNTFSGPVTLWVDIGDFHGTMPPGVTAAFAPNPTTGNSSVLTLTAGAAAVPGVYTLWVYGEASTGWFEGESLTLTVTAP